MAGLQERASREELMRKYSSDYEENNPVVQDGSDAPVAPEIVDNSDEVYVEPQNITPHEDKFLTDRRRENNKGLKERFGDPVDIAVEKEGLDSSFGEDMPFQKAIARETEVEGGKAKVSTKGADLARGLGEIPRGAINGAIEGLEDMINLGPDLLGTDEFVDLPQLSPAETGIGQTAEAAGEFFASFGAWGKILSKLRIMKKNPGLIGQSIKGALADFTVFDDTDKLLGNLIEQYPEELEPVVDMLRANPNDPLVIKKAKAALEGTVFGATADLMIKSMRLAYNAENTKAWLLQKVRDEVHVEQFVGLGDVTSEDLIIKKLRGDEKKASGAKPDDVLAEPEGEMYINWARINESDDVKAVIQQMADLDKAGIDQARRGAYRSWDKVQMDAAEKNKWAVLEKRMKDSGVALNDAENLALRQLWITSGRKLQELASVVKDGGTDADLYAFRKMMAVHYAIQKEAIGARTEAARALAIWRLDVEGDSLELADSLKVMLDENGGKDVARSIAKKIDMLAKMPEGDAEKFFKLMDRTVYARTTEAVAQVWINFLLSNPPTHIVNFVSNSAVMGLSVAERGIASRIRGVMGGEGVEPGEAFSLAMGMKDGLLDVITAGWKSKSGLLPGSKTDFTLLSDDASNALRRRNKIEQPNTALSAEMLGIENRGGAMVADFADNIIGSPGKALAVGDEFFKSFNYRMELNALAERQTKRAVKEGKITKEQASAHKAKLLENPEAGMKAEAVDNALYRTFTQDPDVFLNKMADGIRGLSGHIPAVGLLLLPFKRTPINIATYTLEHSPFAPLLKTFRENVAAGGARRDLAMARLGMGSTGVMAAMDLAMSGRCTGGVIAGTPGEKAHQQRTEQEYSCQFTNPDTGEVEWLSYNRLDPVGSVVAMGADLAQILSNVDAEDMEEGSPGFDVVVATMFATANILVNKTYMESFANFIQALRDDTGHKSRQFGYNTVGSLVPSGVAGVTRIMDPHARVASSWIDAMKRRTPGLSQELPKRRDRWGRTKDYSFGYKNGAEQFLSPVYRMPATPEPIDKELDAIGYYPPNHSSKITMEEGLYAADIDLKDFPHIYDRYVELINSDNVHPARKEGLKDYLNAIVSGNHMESLVYETMKKMGPDKAAEFISDKETGYRAFAKQKLLKEFKTELRPYFERNKRRTVPQGM